MEGQLWWHLFTHGGIWVGPVGKESQAEALTQSSAGVSDTWQVLYSL